MERAKALSVTPSRLSEPLIGCDAATDALRGIAGGHLDRRAGFQTCMSRNSDATIRVSSPTVKAGSPRAWRTWVECQNRSWAARHSPRPSWKRYQDAGADQHDTGDPRIAIRRQRLHAACPAPSLLATMSVRTDHDKNAQHQAAGGDVMRVAGQPVDGDCEGGQPQHHVLRA